MPRRANATEQSRASIPPGRHHWSETLSLFAACMAYILSQPAACSGIYAGLRSEQYLSPEPGRVPDRPSLDLGTSEQACSVECRSQKTGQFGTPETRYMPATVTSTCRPVRALAQFCAERGQGGQSCPHRPLFVFEFAYRRTPGQRWDRGSRLIRSALA